MKEPYRWNYNIKVKTKEGTYEYEDRLDNLENILDKHKGYEEVRAKKLIKKRGMVNYQQLMQGMIYFQYLI